MRKILLLILLVLSCCAADKKEMADKKETDTTDEQRVSSTNTEFVEYLNLLPTVSLPFEANCDNCCDHLSIDYENELVNKFKPPGTSIVGLVSKTKDKAVILVTYPADMIIPSLKVYDLNGNLTGDMTFMTNYCGGEPGFYSRQYFRIEENLSLIQIDTLYETSFDSVTYNTLDTINIKITQKNYRVSEKGEIVEYNAR